MSKRILPCTYRFLVVLAALSISWTGTILLAQEVPPGWSAAAQFRFGVGARALALGSAYTALAEGPTAVYWNPAGLLLAPLEVEGMYTEPFGRAIGYRLQFLGVGGQIPHSDWRIGWLNAHVGGIPNTETGGFFDYDSSVFLGALATEQEMQTGVIRIGLTAKVYRDQLLEGRAQGLGWDFGAILRFADQSIGYCSQDVGSTRFRWRGTGQEPLVVVPWVHRLGIAAHWLDHMLVTIGEVILEPNVTLTFRTGIEWTPINELALRGGLRLEPLPEGHHQVWSLGVGIVPWEGLTIDYCFLRSPLPAASISTDTHVVSVGFGF